MNSQPHHKLISAVLVVVVATLACAKPPSSHPVISNPASPTNPPQQPTATTKPPRIIPTSVPSDQVAIDISETDSQGAAVFQDPLMQQQVAVKVTDADSNQPLKDISVSFVSNGPRLLIFAVDPNNRYLPIVSEVEYRELGSSLEYHGSAKLAAPSKQIGIVEVLLLMKVVDGFQTAKDFWTWINARDRPDLERWGFFSQDYCVNSDQMSRSWKVIVGTASFFLPGPKEVMQRIPAIREFEEWIYIAALAEMGQNKLVDAIKGGVPEGIVRWRVYSINGIPFGVPAVPIGWCLEPINRKDPTSVISWVQYGLNQSDIFVFDHLAGGDVYYQPGGFSNFALEQAGWYSKADILKMIESILGDEICKGYRYSQTGPDYPHNTLEIYLAPQHYFTFTDGPSHEGELYLTLFGWQHIDYVSYPADMVSCP